MPQADIPFYPGEWADTDDGYEEPNNALTGWLLFVLDILSTQMPDTETSSVCELKDSIWAQGSASLARPKAPPIYSSQKTHTPRRRFNLGIPSSQCTYKNSGKTENDQQELTGMICGAKCGLVPSRDGYPTAPEDHGQCFLGGAVRMSCWMSGILLALIGLASVNTKTEQAKKRSTMALSGEI